MSNITTCTKCGKLYEESSEEAANQPGRLCTECFLRAEVERLNIAIDIERKKYETVRSWLDTRQKEAK